MTNLLYLFCLTLLSMFHLRVLDKGPQLALFHPEFCRLNTKCYHVILVTDRIAGRLRDLHLSLVGSLTLALLLAC